MICRDFKITDPLGFHAVPVSRLAKLAKESAHAILAHDPISGPVAATSHLRLLALGLHRGDTLQVCIETDDEVAANQVFTAISQILEPTPAL